MACKISLNHEEDFEPKGSYYIYLLLDSRKLVYATDNAEAFADAIIYAGKGKGNRAMHHIKEAKKALKEDGEIGNEKKINKIHDIWEDGDTVGRRQLTNVKRSTYYGVASTMKQKEKQEVGIALLEEGRKVLAKKGAERYYADYNQI
ncbi:hypothetical protein TSAR_004977 [Trichomalopsis sarcophagae]|uniref:GIY-YIG domain-containing protein n=1 Tax=Trichomalopsis sarcophagae TaxID=543379 RepID=A0A232EEE9_9HYME|nr:hypothetical protein TSAR_004977 [Trichomalopsis sarcophagae]